MMTSQVKSMRLISERFSIDTILQRNQEIVKSAKRILEETRQLVARAKKHCDTLLRDTIEQPTHQNENTSVSFISTAESEDMDRIRPRIHSKFSESSLPNISQFFEPVSKVYVFDESGKTSAVKNEDVNDDDDDDDVLFDESPLTRRMHMKDRKCLTNEITTTSYDFSKEALQVPNASKTTEETEDDSTEIRNYDLAEEKELRKTMQKNARNLGYRHCSSTILDICSELKERKEKEKWIKTPKINLQELDPSHDVVCQIRADDSLKSNLRDTEVRSSYLLDLLEVQREREQILSRRMHSSYHPYYVHPEYFSSTPYTPLTVVKTHQRVKPSTLHATDWKLDTDKSTQTVTKNNKRGYLCNQCGKVYCRKYVLKIHQRVHSGEKPLSCHVCGKCFSDPSNMNKHVKLHESDHVTYPCKLCGRHFIRQRGLLNHLHTLHSYPGVVNDVNDGESVNV